MEVFHQTFSQLSDLFRSMSPGSRITAGLLLVVVVVSLGYLFTGQIASPDTDLMNGQPVPASLIPAMLAAFDAAGLKSTYEIRGTQILVPRGQQTTYLAALADAGALPPNIHDVLAEPMKDASSFMSSADREAKEKVAKQRALSMIVSSMKGVRTAYVLYETKKKGGLRREEATTAVVMVTPAASDSLTGKLVSAIRHLVADAINTPPENVGIVDTDGRNYPGDPDGPGGENRFVTLKRVHAEAYRGKILKTLSYVPGVTVAVSVELNLEKEWSETDIQYNPKGFAFSEMDESVSESSETPRVAGAPGFSSQGSMNTPQRLSGSYGQGSSTSLESTKREVDSIPDVIQKAIKKEGLTPKRVTVSVAVPSSYYKKIWKELNPPEEGEEPATPEQADLATIQVTEEAKIKEAIAILLPVPEGIADAGDLVKITTFQDIPPAEMPVPGMGENAMVWFGQYWSTVGMIGLAAFSLVMLRSMVRSSAPESEVRKPRVASIEGEESERSEEDNIEHRLSRFAGSGRSLRDELSELVKEDPDAAANILKGWIGSAI
ncbi:MAG: hypothetical protein V3R99_11925 [Thermoguttaceae bacterium]